MKVEISKRQLNILIREEKETLSDMIIDKKIFGSNDRLYQNHIFELQNEVKRLEEIKKGNE